MYDTLSSVLDALFSDVPYCKSSQQVKKAIGKAMDETYREAISDRGKTGLQAMGEVMSRYGTVEDAAAMAGTEPPEPPAAPENDRSLRRRFFRVRISILLSAVFCALFLDNLLLGILARSTGYLLMALICAVPGLLFLLPCRKHWQTFSYDTIVLAPQARETFYIYLDRYKKRTVNSFLLFVALTAYFVSVTFERQYLAGLPDTELRALFFGYSIAPAVGGMICFRNLLSAVFLCRATDSESRQKTHRYLLTTGGICLGYLIVSLGITLLLRGVIVNPFLLFYGATVLFIGIFALVNYRKRAAIVFRNLRINYRRITAFSAAILILLTISYMKADRWILQPYIMTVGNVPHTEHPIDYDAGSGVYTIHADDDDFRILHLTDIHIGGSPFSALKDFKALEACYALIEYTRPDLVLITGDLVFPLGIMSFSLNNEAPVMQFASFMRNIGIPWAFTFGNHDTESMASGGRDEICALYESLSYAASGSKLLYPGVQPEITGRSNQMICIENPDGSLRQALFLIDSNDYTGLGVNDYDYIHDDQVDWYAEQVRSLPENTKSMVFFHIPLQQYREANSLYEQGSDEVTYHFGIIGETIIDKICTSDYPSSLFGTALALGSTQAMFCGHDHYNNISLTWQGIRLTYGMSIDYLAMPGISQDTAQRGGELIALHPDGSYSLTQIPLTDITERVF